MTPKYFINKTYPVDIHSTTKAIVTLIKLKDFGSNLEFYDRIVSWMIENMLDKKGYFYSKKKMLYE